MVWQAGAGDHQYIDVCFEITQGLFLARVHFIIHINSLPETFSNLTLFALDLAFLIKINR